MLQFRSDEGAVELSAPDLPHASHTRCMECGREAEITSLRPDVFHKDMEIRTFECPHCGYRMTRRVEK